MIECPEVGVWERYRRGDFDGLNEPQLTSHLAECEPCRQLAEKLTAHDKFADRLRSLFADESPSTWSGGESSATRAASTPPTIAGYEDLVEISRTRFSVVYRAVQQETGQAVAIKVLHSSGFDHRGRERFTREVELLGTLRHEGIVQIYDAGLDRDLYYFVMPFIPGERPDQHVQRLDLPLEARLELIRDICRAVNFAHLNGVVHRDLKPGNIIVDAEGRPHVLDFGLAKMFSDDEAVASALTMEAGQILGTPAFMSPEQTSGQTRAVDHRSDVYSLGVIAYLLLTGKMPYPTDGELVDTLNNIRERDPGSLSLATGRRSRDLDTIIAKALAKEARRRYQSAGEFADDIDRYLGNHPILARPTSALYELTKLARRNRAATLAVLLALTLIVGAPLVFLSMRARQDRAVRELLSSVQPLLQLSDSTKGADLESIARWTDAAELEPELELRLRVFLGGAYQQTGRHDLAIPELERSLALRVAEHGPLENQTLRNVQLLCQSYLASGEVEAALTTSRDFLARAQQRQITDGTIQVRLAQLEEIEGFVAFRRGQLSRAEGVYRSVLDKLDHIAMTRATPAIDARFRSRARLAGCLLRVGKGTEALPLLVVNHNATKTLHGESSDIALWARRQLAECLLEVGKIGAAQTHLQGVLDQRLNSLSDEPTPEAVATSHEVIAAKDALLRVLLVRSDNTGQSLTPQDLRRNSYELLAREEELKPTLAVAKYRVHSAVILARLGEVEPARAQLLRAAEIVDAGDLPELDQLRSWILAFPFPKRWAIQTLLEGERELAHLQGDDVVVNRITAQLTALGQLYD